MSHFSFIALDRQYNALKSELDTAVAAVFASSSFIGGTEVSLFEKEMVACCGVRYALGVDSGTRALELLLRAAGIGEGDEVVTSPFSFVATAAAIMQVGARPLFADIDPVSFNITAESIERVLTPATKAVLPVHLFGQPADTQAIRALVGDECAIIEDACQAVGATSLGSVGDGAALSFYPTKNLGGAGDGGMVLTNDPDLAEKVSLLRNHGAVAANSYHEVGYTARLDGLQAAVLRVKLRYLPEWTRLRKENAAFYSDTLADFVQVPKFSEQEEHLFHQYTICTPERDRLRGFLAEQGVPTAIYYPTPIHLQPAYKELGYTVGSFPVAEEVASKVLSLPVCPFLRKEERAQVVDGIHAFFSGSSN